MPSGLNDIVIVPFCEAHGPAFYRLNREWLDAHDLYELADEPPLADPQREIIAAGGAVFIAESQGEVVGTAAVLPRLPGVVELLKVTVATDFRGRGLGRALVGTCIARARGMNARTLWLVSSSKLADAVRLYERMGFVHVPVPADVPYATADVCMELVLADDN